jgi:hypothetical protein
MNDISESCFGRDVGHHGSEACSAGCGCACRRPSAAEDLAIREAARVARQARLVRGEWTDAGAGLQVRLA